MGKNYATQFDFSHKKKFSRIFFLRVGVLLREKLNPPPPATLSEKKNWIPHALDAKVVGMAEKQIIDNEYYRVLGQQ